MKRKLIISTLLLGLMATSAIGVGHNDKKIEDLIGPAPISEFSKTPGGKVLAQSDTDKVVAIPDKLTIHYQMDNAKPEDYKDKLFYLWVDGVDGVDFEKDKLDDFGMVITVEPKTFKEVHTNFKFIIKNRGTWNGQTLDATIDYTEFPPDKDGNLEVWVMDGEARTVEIFHTFQETQGPKIVSAKFMDWQRIHVKCTGPIRHYELYAFNSYYYNASSQKESEYLIKSGNPILEDIDITFPNFVPASLVFKVKCTFLDGRVKSKFVSPEKLYDTPRFDKYYLYDGDDLGVTYTKEKSTFKVWAPTCSSIDLRVYRNGTPFSLDSKRGSDYYTTYTMNYMEGGIYCAEINEDLNGKYYTYYLRNSTGKAEICDPYAKACGVNGIRGMILDFDSTNPEGWEKIPEVWDKDETYDLKAPNDLTVYEAHIRDMTMDDSWGGKEKQGTYSAFIEKGTTYTKDGVTVKTGFDHMEELGFNAIQILPFFDADNDEIDPDDTNNKIDGNYNWGYNPQNYNCLDGMYSKDPHDGALRVKEFKQLVQAFALNKNHARIIMDVVYNHVSSASSVNLNKVMPKYYFRFNNKGEYATGSGCNNEIRTEAPMMRKLIVDSVKWWASEYKIKGFRFDLMGLIDMDTMRLVKDELYKLDNDIICYGEGWNGGSYNAKGVGPSDQHNVYNELFPTKDSPGILGAFNDTMRDGVRGSNFGCGYGLVSQGASDVGDKAKRTAEGMMGKHGNAQGANPYQTVNYASCHDNFALYDQLRWTLREAVEDGPQVPPSFDIVANALLGVQSTITYSSGIAFFQAGEEVFRSKIEYEFLEKETDKEYFMDMYGEPISHNSYKSNDQTNALDYSRKISVNYHGKTYQSKAYYEKYVSMIQSRKEFSYKLNLTDINNSRAHASYVAGTGNDGNGSTGFKLTLREGEYTMYFAGRVETTLNYSNVPGTMYYSSNINDGGYKIEGDTIKIAPGTLVVFRR